MLQEDNVIDRQVTADRRPHYEPFGWHHWPEHPWFAYQFRRGLGETQEAGGSVSECFQTAARIVPGDADGWHREWLAVAERNFRRAVEADARGHVRTAMNGFLRAVDYYRQHDNPTIGQELLGDWLADVLGIDQRALAGRDV